MFTRGDILKASDRNPGKGQHFIIYYDNRPSENFLGCMLTHLDSPKNEKMSEEHFEKIDEKGNTYKVGYDASFIVKAKLIKYDEWGPFIKVGCLSAAGIKFIERITEGLPPQSFEEYRT